MSDRECFLICHECKSVTSSAAARFIAIVDTERIEQHRGAYEAGAEMPDVTYRATLCGACWAKIESRARALCAPDELDDVDLALDDSPPQTTDRLARFRQTTGALSGCAAHVDRCKCQGDDDTPHAHYAEAPYACARCECGEYRPAVE